MTEHSSWIHEMQEDPGAVVASGRQICRDCGCNSHCWANASRQGAAAAAAETERLLGHPRAATGEGREGEAGLGRDHCPSIATLIPPVHSCFLCDSETDGEQKGRLLPAGAGQLQGQPKTAEGAWRGHQHLPAWAFPWESANPGLGDSRDG